MPTVDLKAPLNVSDAQALMHANEVSCLTASLVTSTDADMVRHSELRWAVANLLQGRTVRLDEDLLAASRAIMDRARG